MTSMETYGSGAWTGMAIIMEEVYRTRKVLRVAHTGFFVAAVGSTSPSVAGRRGATGLGPAPRAATSDSALP